MSTAEGGAPPIALEDREQADDARLFSPSAARNTAPLRQVMARLLPERAQVLEVGSGTGEHGVAFVKARPDIRWAPSDPDEGSRASIAAWTAHEGLGERMAAPFALDVTIQGWTDQIDIAPDAIISINMIHIAPWAASLGVLAGAGQVLKPGGLLIFYGPFMRGGVHTCDSNAEFDASLKSRNPDWGVRDLDDLEREAEAHGLALKDAIAMPANNQVVVWEKR